MKNGQTLPVHPKERAAERFGVKFTKKREKRFYKQLEGRNTIILTKYRRAVYFERNWYLITLTANGTVTTFLPLEAITEPQREVLRNDVNYRRINDDQFHTGFAESPVQPAVLPKQKRKVPLPPPVSDEELEAELNTTVKGMSCELFDNIV
ncbi:MAG: hypothetical protein LBN39_11395 [Planctomycetaceae bacterium]|jgi:hypothetical protein|nr:hypothetical protein [Planctomycetaceae bacterium]